VHRRLLHALVDPRLEPRLEQLEPVALLDFLHQLVSGSHGANRENERANEVLGAVGVEQRACNLRRLHRVDLRRERKTAGAEDGG
jgi:ABC-type ATPase with predicted acetyltransferase domain